MWSGSYPTPSESRIPFRVVDNGLSLYDVVIFTTIEDAVMEYTYIPAGLEDATRGPAGDGGLLTTAFHFDDGSMVQFDDLTYTEAL